MLYSWLQPYYEQFLSSLQTGRVSSSIIIAGDEGLGGRRLALAMAKAYLCQDKQSTGPCNQCRSCLSFERLINKDLKVAYSSTVEEAKKDQDFTYDCSGLIVPPASGAVRSMRIDTMRKIPSFIYESAAGGVGKVVIIDGAEKMSVGAANAILKTFEEPLPGTMIIMLAKSLEQLLPTILSRASKIVLKDIDESEALEYLLNPANQKPPTIVRKDVDLQEQQKEEQQALEACEGLNTPIDDKRALIALALNSYAPLRAMNMLLSGDDIKALEIVQTLIASINNNNPYDVEVLAKLDTLLKEQQINLLRELVLEVLKYKAYVPVEKLPLVYYGNAQMLERLSADHLFEAYDMLSHIEDKTGQIGQRAPTSLMRCWLQAFRADLKATK
ncbi:hypothetical protein MXE38_00865 [Anaerobiospirillum sp. NML120448]|uniref:hypothetical protein n=1 Tax=Anaerobiospirillum sp. NML120448 TaxID=2932816 RepID=UPI001FF37A3F|nr:hypothetical protein [Anaerobiospirillum sp. NML120448]MCK0513429.1 hypothetical protein [Anaerobiospirillum sp. NML120448]